MDISGYADSRFSALQDAFAENFRSLGEVGAAIALSLEGEEVLSLWAGTQDRESETAWTEDTLTNVYSTTKGVAASVVAILVSEGLINYSDPVAKYWPEFAAQGKQDVTIAMMMSHQAGLSGFREPVSMSTIYDSRRAAATLAAMEPLWEPGTAHGYHPLTIGYLVDELCYRVTGQRICELVQTYLSPSCHNSVFIGCPPEEYHRAATIYAPPNLSSADVVDQALDEMQTLALTNPLLDPEQPNSSEWRSAVIASANGFASAKGLSALYGALATIGDDGKPLAISPQVLATCCSPQSSGVDLTLGLESEWGCGFLINSIGVYGPTASAFGHSGWGGSFAFADPKHRIGFAYTMNQMGTDLINDPRNVALIDALYTSL